MSTATRYSETNAIAWLPEDTGALGEFPYPERPAVPRDVLGCSVSTLVALAPPAMVVLGRGRMRSLGMALTALELGSVAVGVKSSRVFK